MKPCRLTTRTRPEVRSLGVGVARLDQLGTSSAADGS